MGFDRFDTTWGAWDLTLSDIAAVQGEQSALGLLGLITPLWLSVFGPLGVSLWCLPITCPQHVLGGGVVRCQPCNCALWVLGSTQLALSARIARCTMLGMHPI